MEKLGLQSAIIAANRLIESSDLVRGPQLDYNKSHNTDNKDNLTIPANLSRY